MKGRTIPYTDADKEVLRRLIQSHPRKSRRQICAMFFRASGRKISLATLDRITKVDRVIDIYSDDDGQDVEIPQSRRGCYPALDDDHRSRLIQLIESRPNATSGQIVAIFNQTSSRKISRGCAYHAMANRKRFANPTKITRYLSYQQKEILVRIISECDTDTPASEIARIFAEETGCTVNRMTAWRFRVKVVGQHPAGRGKNSMVGRMIHSAGRDIEAASRAKLASIPVDRSIRVGRSGRSNLSGE